ncbi:hypothetical protein B0H17DRAFT_1030520 [Mycena rosella]|uniref:Bromodomain and PHD finger-containing protein 3 n=1 Tax=Mycena rosella TaxID=1033263 RepID=A0AAD7GZR8_MYCRO|nr:hypothetical protein B0H17DRAFT_1030520 [Mycena rosella]
MARGGHASPVATATALPKVAFQKIEDDVSTQPSGVHDGQARSFGYNDFSEFHRPDQYIRHIEPLEIDLERQVEYDMDEQDQEWLDAVNTERKKEQLDKVSYEVFEVVMDRLEKEWFNLTKHIPKPDLALPSEDSTCAICDDSEGENSNAIVFCDGCNLAVHQDCYGVPYIPEGQWLCRKCTVSPENPVSCILCPNEGGAFKQTIQGEWIHLLCAIWVPETRVSNDVFMEPIIGVERISKQRWKLKCTICETREGACIQCAKQSCFLAFHVTCARKDKLLLPMKSAQGSDPGALTCFCERHLPKEQADIREAALKQEEEEDEEQYNSTKLSKSARAYAKTYKPGPPLVPVIIIDRILQYISRTTIRKKPDFLALMCKYWSLKREARRGAPLLKRLHLEPWTASTGAKMQGEEEKVMKLEQLQHLRKDLEDLKGLTELSRKRESRKLKQAALIHDILCHALFLHVPKLRDAFESITAYDRNEYFKSPVSKKDVPDYFDVVKNPMSWSNIEHKLDNHQYWDIQAFKDDIQLVLDNAVLYNRAGTTFHKAALRIQTSAQPILAGLDKLSSLPKLRSTPANQADAVPSWTPPIIGDLEPPLEILELLLSSDAIKDESELVLSADPITSLFSFELEKKKPIPPPPPPPPTLADIKAERKRQARLAQRQAQKVRAAEQPAVAQDVQTASAPLQTRVPRTRGAIAAGFAFESEANTQPEASGSVSAPPRRSNASAPVSEAAKAPRQRRASATLPGAGDIPLVDNVDQRESFTMFEQGWILPAGQRRGGRVPIDRPILPPPKKKMRLGERHLALWVCGIVLICTSIDRGSTSRLSVFSTAASENQTLQGGSPRGDEPPVSTDASHDADNSMDVDMERPSSSRPSSTRNRGNRSVSSVPPRVLSLPVVTPDRVAIPPPNVIRTPDGQVIIEELDTPAIRKEKSIRRREERLAAEAAAAAADAALPSQMDIDNAPPSPITTSESDLSPDPNDGEDADGSDLSALSEVESDAEPGEPGSKERDKLDGEKDGWSGAVDAPDGEQERDRPNGVHEAQDVEQDEQDGEGEQDERDGDADEPAPEQDESVPEQDEPVPEQDEPIPEQEKPVPEQGGPNGEQDAASAEQGETVTEQEDDHAGKDGADAEQGKAVPQQDAADPEQDDADAEHDEADAEHDEADEADGEQDDTDGEREDADGEQDEPIPEQNGPDGRDEADVEPEPAPLPAPAPATRSTKKTIKDLGHLVLPPGQKRLEPGTLVWAKAVSFPWWPAVIFDDKDPMVPLKVVAEAEVQRKKRTAKGPLHIVRFFDKAKSWQYPPLDKMRQLGEIKELDADMLSKTSTMQKKSDWRNSFAECQLAYEQAMEEMESGDEKAKFIKA